MFYLLIYYGFARFLPKSNTPIIGTISKGIRRFLCKRIFSKTGNNINVEQGAYFGKGKDIIMGNNAGFGKNFKSLNRSIILGNEVMMGEEVMFLGGGHRFDRLDIPISKQNDYGKTPLVVSDDVWIGARVIILPGCKHIGTGVVIGAGSVITKNIPDYAVVGGNPAKIIKFRNTDGNKSR